MASTSLGSSLSVRQGPMTWPMYGRCMELCVVFDFCRITYQVIVSSLSPLFDLHCIVFYSLSDCIVFHGPWYCMILYQSYCIVLYYYILPLLSIVCHMFSLTVFHLLLVLVLAKYCIACYCTTLYYVISGCIALYYIMLMSFGSIDLFAYIIVIIKAKPDAKKKAQDQKKTDKAAAVPSSERKRPQPIDTSKSACIGQKFQFPTVSILNKISKCCVKLWKVRVILS